LALGRSCFVVTRAYVWAYILVQRSILTGNHAHRRI
jgi:hypothetical protein